MKLGLFLVCGALAAAMIARATPVWAQRPLPAHLLRVAQLDDEPPPHEAPASPKAEVKKAPEPEAPIYRKWWFWALTAAVVGGTIALGVTLAKPGAAHPPAACAPDVVACFGDGRAP